MAAYIWWGTPELPARALRCSTNVGSLEESLLAAGVGYIRIPVTRRSHGVGAECWLGRCGRTLAAGNGSSLLRPPRSSVRVVWHIPHNVSDLTDWVANRATAVRYGVSITSFCGSQVPNLPVSRIGNIAAHQ